jgi:PE family
LSYVVAAPEMMTAAATDLATIGSTLDAAHLAAATPTVALVPAAADEVSAGVARLFSGYAENFHALSGQASVFHGQFAQNLKASAASYTQTENNIAVFLSILQRDIAISLPQGSPIDLVSALPALLLNGGLFVGLILFGIFGLFVGLIVAAIRAVQAALGLPLLPYW